MANSGMVKESTQAIGDLYKAIIDASRYTTASLTKYTKDTNIIGRVYIQNDIRDEDVIIPLLGVLNQMYCGLVLTALNLDSFVSGSKKVRDLVQLVSTESWVEAVDLTAKQFGVDRNDLYRAMLEEGMIRIGEAVHYPGEVSLEAESPKSASRLPDAGGGTKAAVVDPLNQKLISGRIQEVTFTTENGQKITAVLNIQLVPQIISSESVAGFLQLNFVSNFWRRLRQARAGEIRFFKDFIMAFDQIEAYKNALKADKDGWLYRMMHQRQSKLWKYFRGILGLDPENHNSANSILICEQTLFDKTCAKAGTNFKNAADRNTFFRKSFTMMVVTVDTMYKTVTMYFNGLDVIAEYSFDQVNSSSKASGDSVSLKDIMTLFGQNSVPRF